MSGFGSGRCAICDRRIVWDDVFCSDLCEAEAEARAVAREARLAYLETDPGPEEKEAGMTSKEQARAAIACLAHECVETLDLEPQAVRVTIDLDGGRRLRVSRDGVWFGPKKKLADVTGEVREDIARLVKGSE